MKITQWSEYLLMSTFSFFAFEAPAPFAFVILIYSIDTDDNPTARLFFVLPEISFSNCHQMQFGLKHFVLADFEFEIMISVRGNASD
jgi:hypothetical protein